MDRDGEKLNQGRMYQHDGRQSTTIHKSDVNKVPETPYEPSNRREKRDVNLQNHLGI